MPNIPTELNNPGDLRFIGQQDATPSSSGFASFSDPKQGFSALLNDVQSKINNHPNWNLGDFSNAYAPASDGNDPAQYTANLANHLRVPPDTPISSLQGRIGDFAEAIASNEGYQGNLPSLQDHPLAQPQQYTTTDNQWLDSLSSVVGLNWLPAAGAALVAPFLAGGASSFLGHAATDVPLGAVAGTIAEPGGGTLAGAGAGLVEAGVQTLGDVIGGGGNPPSGGGTSSGGEGGTSGVPPIDLNSIQESSSAGNQLTKVLTEALQGTQSNRVYANSLQGKTDTINAGVYGYAPDIENGTMNFQNASQKASQNETAAANIEQLAAGGSQVPMMAVLNEAGRLLGEKDLPSDKRTAVAEKIREYSDAVSPSNQSISGEEAIRQRHGNYSYAKNNWSKLSSDEVEARKIFGAALRNVSLKYSKNPEVQKFAIKEQQKHINAKKMMKRLEGKKAPIEKQLFKTALLKTAARYAEIYIGDKIGGPIGAILGYMAGEKLNHHLAKRLQKTKFDTPQMKAAMDILKDAKPEVYNRIKSAFEKVGASTPSQKEKPHTTKSGLVKDIKKDLGKISGLVKTSKPSKSKAKSQVVPQSPRPQG